MFCFQALGLLETRGDLRSYRVLVVWGCSGFLTFCDTQLTVIHAGMNTCSLQGTTHEDPTGVSTLFKFITHDFPPPLDEAGVMRAAIAS